VFGVANFASAVRVAPDMDVLRREVMRITANTPPPASFRVSVSRADKAFATASPEVERDLGAILCRERGWRVGLDFPELVVRVEIVPGAAYCTMGREVGPGGLPSGVSGRALCLLSGGIDSPVAAWRLMRRGTRVVFVHFHAYPILSRASLDKAERLVRVLTTWQLQSRLWTVAFGDAQRQVVTSVPPALRIVVYRRLMLRIADRIAPQGRARALVTGEVVGQVASQTLDNLAVIGAATRMPVLRPLIGMDKEEITAQARRIGTYDISIEPDEDCCTLFTPSRPATGARPSAVDAAESALNVEALVTEAARSARFTDVGFAEAMAWKEKTLP
jgi:thiamine biosynthesis protein ThiI